MKQLIRCFLLLAATAGFAQHANLESEYQAIEAKVIDWRHDIHQFPELSNREFKTAEKIAAHLKSLGIEVQTGVAHTGVSASSRETGQAK